MIQVKNVVKQFDGYRALDGLNINVPKGAVYGLVGPNGAGKSTVIRHIAGIYRQDEGEILVAGQPVFENPEIKSKIAYIPDDIYYFMSASTVDMMRFYKGIYPRFDMKRYEALKDIFKLDEKKPIRKLSKGMQKQSAFWLAICLRPEILILDEPVDGLDPVMRRQIWSILLGDVSENGTTVLVSSHNLRELEDVCDHVGIIHKGKNLLERSLSELQENIAKVQFVTGAEGKEPEGLNVLHDSRSGKVRTLIVRGSMGEVDAAMERAKPLFYDKLPLSLEEIFIYELGGSDYAVKDILL